jgi:hypothetical protein
MEPIDRTPTEPRHYAAISAVWAGALAATAVAAVRRGTPPPRPAELPVLGLATYALARAVSREKAETWLRTPFLDEGAGVERRRPRGSGMRFAIGELLACTRCTGTWAGLAVGAAGVAAPRHGPVAIGVLAVVGANDLLQAGQAALVAVADRG